MSADGFRENLRHPHRQGRRAPRAPEQGVFPHQLRQFIHVLHRDRETEGRDLGRHRRRLALHVHREIHARVHRASGDHGHDGHQRFQAHGPVANGPRVTLAGDELGRSPAGDERVKTGNGAAGDGDETKRKHRPRHHQSGAVHKLRQRRHPQIGQHEKNANRQHQDGAELHEGAQIIARRQQQPHRQHARRQAIKNERPSQRLRPQREHPRPRRRFINQLAAPHRQQQGGDAQDRTLQHLAHAHEPQIPP